MYTGDGIRILMRASGKVESPFRRPVSLSRGNLRYLSVASFGYKQRRYGTCNYQVAASDTGGGERRSTYHRSEIRMSDQSTARSRKMMSVEYTTSDDDLTMCQHQIHHLATRVF